jgi:hexosaminidase
MLKVFSLTFFILFSLLSSAQKNCPIIPQPIGATASNNQFKLDRHTMIKFSDPKLNGIANYLKAEIKKNTSIELDAQPSKNSSLVSLVLMANKPQNSASPDAYSLDMSKGAIVIASSSEAGLFNGVASLLQLMRLAENKAGMVMLDCWQIKDAPGYGWRGLMLDESRHFFGLEKLKSLIDWMAFYKLNRFHWHLTDEPSDLYYRSNAPPLM